MFRLKNRTGPIVTDINMYGNKMRKKAVIIAFIIMIALVCIGATFYALWNNGAFLPRWIEWGSGVFYDRSGEYEVLLNRKSVCVTYRDAVIWNSPDGVKVQKALSYDIDNDEEDELVLLCWKRGRYGRHRPFWVEKDEKKWSQHIFVYEYEGGEIQPKWMSSYIGQEVADLAGNGKDAPFARLLLTGRDGKISSWMWDSWGFTKEATDVSFVVFGDNLIHGSIYRYGLYHDETFGFLFEGVKDVIAKSDVAVIHQETPLTDNPSRYSDYPRFGTPANVGQAIADAGFDAVTCAGNHALDQGVYGVNFTKGFFDSHGVECLGIQSENEKGYIPYQVIVRNGIRFALLNYTYGTNGIKIPEGNPHMVHLLDDEGKIREDLDKARADADFVIVFAHWGTEYSQQTDEFQQRWTRVFLDGKADVVVGTHPHTLQPYEVLKDDSGHEMLVYYSIGNFISAQKEEFCVKGGMASFTVSLTDRGYRITEYALQPLEIVRREDGGYMVKIYCDVEGAVCDAY